MWIMLQVQFLGGQVASVLDHKCTHVLVDEKGDLARVAQYDRQFRSWAQRPKVRQRQRERETERDRDRERQRLTHAHTFTQTHTHTQHSTAHIHEK